MEEGYYALSEMLAGEKTMGRGDEVLCRCR